MLTHAAGSYGELGEKEGRKKKFRGGGILVARKQKMKDMDLTTVMRDRIEL